jgi:hypothetical protein
MLIFKNIISNETSLAHTRLGCQSLDICKFYKDLVKLSLEQLRPWDSGSPWRRGLWSLSAEGQPQQQPAGAAVGQPATTEVLVKKTFFVYAQH